jgi:hypothetical protein
MSKKVNGVLYSGHNEKVRWVMKSKYMFDRGFIVGFKGSSVDFSSLMIGFHKR